MRRLAGLLATALVLGVTPALAQPEKLVDVNIGAGVTFPISDVRDQLGDGYNINAGITFNLTDRIGLQAEYSFNGLGQKQIDIPVAINPIPGAEAPQPFYADMNMQYGDFNLVFKPAMEGAIKPYLVAGGGIYYRPVKVTTPGVGYVPGYCNPWWYVCYPGGFVPVDYIVGERSSTDFGIDLGGGVTIGMGESVSAYIEARYHYIWGPEITNPTTKEVQKANGQFFPITFGLKF